MIEAIKKYKNIINNKIDNAIFNDDKAIPFYLKK